MHPAVVWLVMSAVSHNLSKQMLGVISKTTSGKNTSLTQSPKFSVALISPGDTHSKVFSPTQHEGKMSFIKSSAEVQLEVV